MNILGWLLCIFVVPIILAGHLLVLPLALLMPIAPLCANLREYSEICYKRHITVGLRDTVGSYPDNISPIGAR